MQNLIKATVLSLLLSSPVFADQFYIGIDTGVDTSIFKQDAHVFQPGNTNVLDKERQAGKGYLGGLLLGYSTRYACYYIAAELNATISTLEFNSANLEFFHNNFSRTSYRINHHYGLSILPGLILDESTLLYVLIGAESGNFKVNTSDVSLQNIHKKLSGIRYGLGIEKAVIWPTTSIRFEYSNITYNKANMRTLDTGSNTSKHTWIRTETNQFALAFIYRFNCPTPVLDGAWARAVHR